jgi:hypothetical protein
MRLLLGRNDTNFDDHFYINTASDLQCYRNYNIYFILRLLFRNGFLSLFWFRFNFFL